MKDKGNLKAGLSLKTPVNQKKVTEETNKNQRPVPMSKSADSCGKKGSFKMQR